MLYGSSNADKHATDSKKEVLLEIFGDSANLYHDPLSSLTFIYFKITLTFDH